MILDLDQRESLDARRVGPKAARLARGREAGLPILPGIVITEDASWHHMELGARTLPTRGSGGARLAISREPIAFSSELISAGAALGKRLVARSSTALEGTGEWSGAFTSYLDLEPEDLPKAVAGCWAAAFSVAALERLRSAGIEPGSLSMPVLIQPALQPRSGGIAELEPDGTVVVYGVEGPPGPLLQGWISGHLARSSGETEQSKWIGFELIELVGVGTLDQLAAALRKAEKQLGFNRCEWAYDGDVWILQLDMVAPPVPRPEAVDISKADKADLVRLVQTAMQSPGRLGEELVMPWAVKGYPVTAPADIEQHHNALGEAIRLSSELTAQVWGMPSHQAAQAAQAWISEVLGPNPAHALEQLRNLRLPDPMRASKLMSLLRSVRAESVLLGVAPSPEAAWYLSTREIHEVDRGHQPATGTRAGIGRWEPFVASVVLAVGEPHRGLPASSGIGAGLRLNIEGSTGTESFPPRTVVVSSQPLPSLASLLWDSAAVVTETGSPAAHLFESARSLGVPAVCGVSTPGDSDQIVAVDGYTGLVATIPLYGEV